MRLKVELFSLVSLCLLNLAESRQPRIRAAEIAVADFNQDEMKDEDGRIDLRKLLNPPATKIVGGTEVQKSNNRFLWVASLQRGSSNFPFCGGSLISPNFVMTAGHCVKYSGPDRVVIGNYDLSKKNAGEIRTVTEVIRHPRYAGVNFDIALLRLNKEVKSVTPIILSMDLFDSPQEDDDQMQTVIGWGYTSEGSGIVQDRLRRVDVPIVSQTRCRRSYSGIDETKVCAGYDFNGKDSCSGDSGGPLFYSNPTTGQIIQTGIVSYGRGCARKSYYGVYARVSYFINWIEEQLGDHGDILQEPQTISVPTNAPTPAPTDFNPGDEYEEKEWQACSTAENRRKCRNKSRRNRCFWNNGIVSGHLEDRCLPNFMLPTLAPTLPTPAPTRFEPSTIEELDGEMNYCHGSKRLCNKDDRVSRCFWNNKSEGNFTVSYLKNKCLPRFFEKLFHKEETRRLTEIMIKDLPEY